MRPPAAGRGPSLPPNESRRAFHAPNSNPNLTSTFEVSLVPVGATPFPENRARLHRNPNQTIHPHSHSHSQSQVEAEDDKDIDYVAQAVADMSVATTGPPSSVSGGPSSVSSLPPSPPHQRKSAAAAAATPVEEDVSLSWSKPPFTRPQQFVDLIYLLRYDTYT